MCIRFARTTFTGNDEKIVLEAWEREFSNIPTVISMLHPRYKLQFEHFGNEHIPRLTERTGPVHTGELDESQCLSILSVIRTQPLQIDPVCSSEQSSAEFAKAKAAMQAAVRVSRGPTLSATSAVFDSDFVLARLTANTASVSLLNVASHGALQQARSPTLNLRCTVYEHTPNPDVSGLFGTFAMKMITGADGKRHQVKVDITRENIVVYNALVQTAKSKLLTLETLRTLSIALPTDYPMPSNSDIPETHLVHEDSSSEDSSDEDEPMPRSWRKKGPKSKRPQPARARPKKVVRSSADEDEDEDEEEKVEEEQQGTSSDRVELKYLDIGSEADVHSCRLSTLSFVSARSTEYCCVICIELLLRPIVLSCGHRMPHTALQPQTNPKLE